MNIMTISLYLNILTLICIPIILILHFKIKKEDKKFIQKIIDENIEASLEHEKALEEIEHAINKRKKI